LDSFNKFSNILTDELLDALPPYKEVDHKIEVVPGMVMLSKEKLKKQLNDLLSQGYIQQNKSSYGGPILFVDKKDGKLRMCIDYHALNKITIKNNYLMPCIDDLLDRLNGAKYFNQIDLKSRYYQIHIVDEDVEKMAMKTKYCSYEFLVMSFRLCNAS
jgi:hypothetical protein